MNIISFEFLIFILFAIILYYIIPAKFKWLVLLCFSVLYFTSFGVTGFLIFLVTSISTYFLTTIIGKIIAQEKQILKNGNFTKDEKKEIKAKYKFKTKIFMLLGVFINLGMLLTLKYSNFFIENFFGILNYFNLELVNSIPKFNFIMPIGISFYTLTTLGYLIDVYNRKYSPEKNIAKLLLFIGYFPHVLQGPIAKYPELSKELFATDKSFNYTEFVIGLEIILWGYFKKLVIADNLGRIVNFVYSDYNNFNGTQLFIATAIFSIQIYADFSGFIDIVSGISKLFNVKLSVNFNRPYFSKTMPEFWRRWHISLGAWFREYLFFPISVSKPIRNINKFSRKLFGNSVGRIISGIIPIFFVWFSTGLWHGYEWKYIFWGLYHCVLIILSLIFTPLLTKVSSFFNFFTKTKLFSLLQMTRTFLLCLIGRVFFRAKNMDVAMGILRKFKEIPFEIHTLTRAMFIPMSVSKNQQLEFLLIGAVTIFSVIILLIASLLQEYGKIEISRFLVKNSFILRWTILYAGIILILLFGNFNISSGAFLYEQF